MFERFTDRARRVVVMAQEETRRNNHDYIGTEHLLAAFLIDQQGVAAQALQAFGVSLEAVRQQVQALIGQGNSTPGGHIPFTPNAKKVIELSLREALALNHNYIGTEHLLLGFIRHGESVGFQVLVKLGVDSTSLRNKVLELLNQQAPADDQLPKVGAKTGHAVVLTIRGQTVEVERRLQAAMVVAYAHRNDQGSTVLTLADLARVVGVANRQEASEPA